MAQSEALNSGDTTIKEILQDPEIGNGLIQSALTSITSMFSPRREAQSEKDTPTKGHLTVQGFPTKVSTSPNK